MLLNGQATWVDLTTRDLDAVDRAGHHFLGGVHAASHALMRAAFVRCSEPRSAPALLSAAVD